VNVTTVPFAGAKYPGALGSPVSPYDTQDELPSGLAQPGCFGMLRVAELESLVVSLALLFSEIVSAKLQIAKVDNTPARNNVFVNCSLTFMLAA